MSSPGSPPLCTVVFGLLRSPELGAAEVLGALSERFGPTVSESPWVAFTGSRYYEREMGPGLLRGFASLEGLRDPADLAAWKLAANELEGRFAREGRRRANLDAGLLDLGHVVLASGKASGHRLYLGRGIHAELVYVFQGDSFRPVPWTYADYREAGAIQFFNGVRRQHKEKLRATAAQGAACPGARDQTAGQAPP